MAKVVQPGRLYVLKKGSDTLSHVRTVSVSLSGESIRTTNQGSNNWEETLNEEGVRSGTISVQGLFAPNDVIGTNDGTGEVLQDEFLNNRIAEYTLEDKNGDTWVGDFKVTSYEQSAEYNAEVTFSATLELSGALVYSGN